MRDAFSDFHPVVNMTYFIVVVLFSMFVMHPVCLGISLTASVAYALCLKGRRGARFGLRVTLPMLLLVMLVNPVFNHAGVTILAYWPSGNPLTLESLIYGAAMACLMASVLQWFACFTQVMTTDKFVYLFGRVMPSLSLVLSMTLRFVPRFRVQFHQVREAQRCIGRDISTGSVRNRLRHAANILSIMITWSMENAMETADSMKGRGYGLPGRTAFSPYRLERRDFAALGIIVLLAVYVGTGWMTDTLFFWYFPAVTGSPFGWYPLTVYLAYALLCFLPVMLHAKEVRQWRLLRSNM